MVAGLAGNPAICTAKVYNPSTAEDAYALRVTGRGNVGAQLANDVDTAGKLALNVMGNTHMVSYTGANAAHKTLHVVNENANVEARALLVEGKSELDGQVIVPNQDVNAPALEVTNNNAGGNARAFKANGVTELNGLLSLGGDVEGTGGRQINFNDEVHMNGVFFIEAGGECVGNFTFQDDLLVRGQLDVGDGAAAGLINSQGVQDLNIGGLNTTADVNLGRNGQDVNVVDDLNVGGDCAVVGSLVVGPAAAAASIDAGGAPNAQDLNIGTQASTDDVTIGRDGHNVTVNGSLIVGGAAAAAARIDAELDGAATRDLHIGTQATTDDIQLGRAGKDVTVMEDLNVFGGLKVGTANDNGLIDSNGVALAQRKLKIGSGAGTSDVMLSRAGQTIDMFGQERLNSNACVLNGAANITAANGIGFIVNAAGHGNGPSIDFYINGVMVRYCDVTGWF